METFTVSKGKIQKGKFGRENSRRMINNSKEKRMTKLSVLKNRNWKRKKKNITNNYEKKSIQGKKSENLRNGTRMDEKERLKDKKQEEMLTRKIKKNYKGRRTSKENRKEIRKYNDKEGMPEGLICR